MDPRDQIRDELLLLRCQQGDAAAFPELVLRWQSRLFAHALRLTDDRAAAADVVQESWLAVLRGLGGLTDVTAFPAWVFRIVTRRAADWVRQRRRERRLTADYLDRGDPPGDAAPTPGGGRLASLQEALAGLTPEQRGLISLYYVEGFATEDVADILGIPRGTVKSRLFQARQRIRALMETEGR